MKTIKSTALIIGTLLSIKSFGYGQKFSTGAGITCTVTVSTKANYNQNGVCKPQVVGEEEMSGSGINIDGVEYKTIGRTVNDTNCIENAKSVLLDSMDSDLSIKSELQFGESLSETFFGSFVQVEQNSSGVPTELNHGVIEYIYYTANEYAKSLDQILLNRVYSAIKSNKPSVVYDDNSKTLSLFLKGSKLVSTQNVDFAKGVKTQHAVFEIASQNLNQSLKLDKRTYRTVVQCSPLSAKKVQ